MDKLWSHYPPPPPTYETKSEAKKVATPGSKSKNPTVLNSMLRNIRLLSPVTKEQTLEWAADKLGIPKGQLSKLERGEISEPKKKVLEKMLELYECPSELEMLMRSLICYEPSELAVFGNAGQRSAGLIEEAVEAVTESGAHNVVRFLDEFLIDRIDEVHLEWTTYHISANAIRGSIQTNKNHWLLARHRREWFTHQAALPHGERRIHIVPAFKQQLIQGNNTVYVDRLFAYQEIVTIANWQKRNEVAGLNASAELLEQLQKCSDQITQSTAIEITPKDIEYIITAAIQATNIINSGNRTLMPSLAKPKRSWR
jgi:transcriptional regulator with XRE-family HTH domain